MKDNKLIAEFMGYKFGINDNENAVIPSYGYYKLKDFEYHSSWDCLMPVLKKIQEVDENYRYGWDDKLLDEFLDANIDEVYKAIIGFIKLYNKQK